MAYSSDTSNCCKKHSFKQNWSPCLVVHSKKYLTCIYVSCSLIYRLISGCLMMTVSLTLPLTSSRLLVWWQTILQNSKIILMAVMSLESLWTLPLEVKGVSWLKKSDRSVCSCQVRTENTDGSNNNGALVIEEVSF